MHISLFALLFLLFVVAEASATISEVARKKINSLITYKEGNKMGITPLDNYVVPGNVVTSVTIDEKYHIVIFKNILIKDLSNFVIDEQESKTGHLKLKFHTLSISCDITFENGNVYTNGKFHTTGKDVFATSDATGLDGNRQIKMKNTVLHKGSQFTSELTLKSNNVKDRIRILTPCGNDYLGNPNDETFRKKLYLCLLEDTGSAVEEVFNDNFRQMEKHDRKIAKISEVARNKINRLKAYNQGNEGMGIVPIDNFVVSDKVIKSFQGLEERHEAVFSNILIKDLSNFVINEQYSNIQGLLLEFHTLSISCDVTIKTGHIHRNGKLHTTGKNVFATSDATGLDGSEAILLQNMVFHNGVEFTSELKLTGRNVNDKVGIALAGKNSLENRIDESFRKKLYLGLLEGIGDPVSELFNYNLGQVEKYAM